MVLMMMHWHLQVRVWGEGLGVGHQRCSVEGVKADKTIDGLLLTTLFQCNCCTDTQAGRTATRVCKLQLCCTTYATAARCTSKVFSNHITLHLSHTIPDRYCTPALLRPHANMCLLCCADQATADPAAAAAGDAPASVDEVAQAQQLQEALRAALNKLPALR